MRKLVLASSHNCVIKCDVYVQILHTINLGATTGWGGDPRRYKAPPQVQAIY